MEQRIVVLWTLSDNMVFIKGYIPWNKGLKGYSSGRIVLDETKKKLSIAIKQYYKDHNGPFMGKRHSDETKRKIKETKIKSGFKGYGYSKQRFDKSLGHYVRSTWEANFARILIYEEINYEYEPKRFDLGKIGSYLPDFYLPSYNLYIEIKGYMSEISKKKINKFSKMKNLLLIDKKEYKNLIDFYKNKIDTQ